MEAANRRPEWDILLIACQKNQPAKIRQLLEQDGVSPNHANSIQQSALHVAALWSHYDCLQLLLQAGAIVNRANTISGATPLHSCIQSTKPYSTPASTLSSSSSSVCVPITSATETQQQELLVLQQQARKFACARLLLEYGADPQWTDYQGQTAVEYWDERYDPLELKELLTPVQHVPELFAALYELKQMVSSSSSSTTTTTGDDNDDTASTTKNQQLESLGQRISSLIQSSNNSHDDNNNPSSVSIHILQTRHEGLTPLLQLVTDICDRPDDNNNNSDHDNNKYQLQVLQWQADLLQKMLKQDASPNDLPLTPKSSVPTNNGMVGFMNTTTAATTQGSSSMPSSLQSQSTTKNDYSLSAIHQVCEALVEEATHPTTNSAVFPPFITTPRPSSRSSNSNGTVVVRDAQSSSSSTTTPDPNTTTTTTTTLTPTEPFQTCSCRFHYLWNVAHVLMEHGAMIPDVTHDLIHIIARGRNMKREEDVVLYLAQFWWSTLQTLPNHTNRQGMTPLQFAARSGKQRLVQFMLETLPLYHHLPPVAAAAPSSSSLAAAEVAADTDTATSKHNDSQSEENGLNRSHLLNPCQADHRGQTPLDAAKVNGHDGIVKLLESYYPSCSST
jgi:ankyrin repeat protein